MSAVGLQLKNRESKKKEGERKKKREEDFCSRRQGCSPVHIFVSYFFGLRSLKEFSKNDSAALQGSLGASVISLIE